MQQQRRRSGMILGVLALGLLAGAALTVGPAQAVDAIGPYYAEPAWDRKMAPVNRFVVLTDWNSEAVLDKETGLVWERSINVIGGPLHSWSDARLSCPAHITGNRTGWRLPSVHELASLVDPSQVGLAPVALPPGHPFLDILDTNVYWSATSDAITRQPDGRFATAWTVNFVNGFLSPLVPKGVTALVWCVRGGMNAAVY
jgi:hypothetical protein